VLSEDEKTGQRGSTRWLKRAIKERRRSEWGHKTRKKENEHQKKRRKNKETERKYWGETTTARM